MFAESHYVYDLCMFIFNNSSQVKKSLLKNTFKLFATSVKYYNLENVFNQDLISKFLEDLSKIPASRLDIMKCFGEICK